MGLSSKRRAPMSDAYACMMPPGPAACSATSGATCASVGAGPPEPPPFLPARRKMFPRKTSAFARAALSRPAALLQGTDATSAQGNTPLPNGAASRSPSLSLSRISRSALLSSLIAATSGMSLMLGSRDDSRPNRLRDRVGDASSRLSAGTLARANGVDGALPRAPCQSLKRSLALSLALSLLL